MSHPPFPRRIGAVVLDVDGTLLDTEAIYVRSFIDCAAELGQPLPDGFLHTLIGLPGGEFQARLRAGLGEAFPYAEHRRRYLIRRGELMRNGVPVKPGAVELIDALAARGLPMAIATAATRENAEANLRGAGLRDRFAIVLTRDDVINSKPAPDLFLKAAERIGIDPDLCVAVEDSHNGVRSAHAAGMMTVMVPDILAATEEIRTLCVAVVGSLHEVRELLRLA